MDFRDVAIVEHETSEGHWCEVFNINNNAMLHTTRIAKTQEWAKQAAVLWCKDLFEKQRQATKN